MRIYSFGLFAYPYSLGHPLPKHIDMQSVRNRGFGRFADQYASGHTLPRHIDKQSMRIHEFGRFAYRYARVTPYQYAWGPPYQGMSISKVSEYMLPVAVFIDMPGGRALPRQSISKA